MRISESEKQQFIRLAQRYFGDQARVYLFGSRVDDARKGGDIDLYVESKQPVDMEQKLSFLAEVEKNITTRKLDLLVKQAGEQDRPIYKTARESGVLLC